MDTGIPIVPNRSGEILAQGVSGAASTIADTITQLSQRMRQTKAFRQMAVDGLGMDEEQVDRMSLPQLQGMMQGVALKSEQAQRQAQIHTTMVKKGRAHEYPQLLTDGKIGRRFQDLRVIGIKTVEAGVPSAKLFVQFEVFGDNTAAPTNGVGFEAALFAGSQQLASLSSSSLFLPYANYWYPNRSVFEVPVADFDQADRLEFIAKPEEVRTV